ncbi:hypothetical protein AMATHDRAFT_74468 [Amanita thiersii Skay4041]|uniref:Elongator complex protein 1 n=1 Tax=Amanita thiersii Skay4041 TaxID=703135 RepID=A0A2A9NWU4_9AGAR|nr:hypothetical protein AMATHDRAFT_74468 [Amanita thiersii Skay4041]
MRNLSLYALSFKTLRNAKISATALDVDDNVLYAASESKNPDSDVDVELWKLPLAEAEIKEGDEFSSSPYALFTGSIVGTPEMSQVVSLKVLQETRSIVAIMRSGDINCLPLESDLPLPEVEGTVETGICAAAWSQDDLLLALVTGEEKLILMSSTFDVISEAPIETSEFGEDAPINVGWGSKQTQFHGSLGKSAAQAPAQSKIGSSPDDDGMSRISWRGDAQYFVVSTLSSPASDGLRRRILRVYDRQAVLQSTSEAVGGLEHTLAWKPSGNLIAGTQRFGFEGGGRGKRERHDIVFFERNGLRHGEFGLQSDHLSESSTKKWEWGYRVRKLDWNSDSTVLSVWIEREEGDLVQLWTTGNYHWYLKQEIPAPSQMDRTGTQFTSVNWHPENPRQLFLSTDSEVIIRTYGWETFVSSSQPPLDSGSVAVFDCLSILLTPFRTQNIPPPMSSYKLSINPDMSSTYSVCRSRIPIHCSFSSEGDLFAILWESGYTEVWNLKTRIGPVPGKVMDPEKIWSGTVGAGIYCWRQILIRKAGDPHTSFTIIGLGASKGGDVITMTNLLDGTIRHTLIIPSVDPEMVRETTLSATLPVFCLAVQMIELPTIHADVSTEPPETERFYIGLSASGKLYITGTQHNSKVLANYVTSFTIASGFVIYTASTHECWFIPLKALHSVFSADEEEMKRLSASWENRKIERGSRIVVAVPSSMALVLQMPRGNLETINPRPLVMKVVRQDLDVGDYRKAFLACRKHRIDLTVIVEHDEETFFERVAAFIEQVHEVDYINLFLTVIGRSTLSAEIIGRVCDTVRVELEKVNLTKYVNSIMTAHVVKTPPDHESALALLLRLRENSPNIIEEAVKYIIFLVDADRLFDTALGMYDFSLVLMIAQQSQKDPREYLPFLRELRALDGYYQRFRIDDHLKRHESALKNLSLAGAERFQEVLSYTERHQLYPLALSIWKNTEQYDSVLELYGDWLFERRDFRQAALVFVEAHKLPKAMLAHERALEWRELFNIAATVGTSEDEIIEVAYRLAEDLVTKKRHAEAGQVLLDYAKDVRQAVIALVEGNCFSEARRIVSDIVKNQRTELLGEIVHPAAMDSRVQIGEDLKEMTEQLRKQVNRLRELRIRKVEQPDAFYGTEDPTLHDVDVMTDISMAGTAFTRYTQAPSTASRTSKRSSRSKRKLERKVGSGRKGTVDEEEYLLKSVTKLVSRFRTTRGEAGDLLPHLLQFTPEHRQEGRSLQNQTTEFEAELSTALEEVWAKQSAEDGNPQPVVDSWAARMDELARNKAISPIDKIAKPELSRRDDWRIELFDMGK